MNGQAAQADYWDEWNATYRFRDDRDDFMHRQAAIVADFVATHHLREIRSLDVGCGNGWLAATLLPFGSVQGTDLSPEAIADGRERFPGVDLVVGDFMTLELAGPFDLVLSSDSLVPMPDHAACIERIAGLLEPGGWFLLMSQNPAIWSRRSTMNRHASSVPNGDVSKWPTKDRLRELLAPRFDIEEMYTFAPGGDTGALFWVENRYIRKAMSTVMGRARYVRLLERLGLGREFVIFARRS